ncbi:MAG: hypothetical protein FWE84_04700 [Firmicutes bacterium]|nr:hypothetical protein [Bacillota bacterium]
MAGACPRRRVELRSDLRFMSLAQFPSSGGVPHECSLDAGGVVPESDRIIMHFFYV